MSRSKTATWVAGTVVVGLLVSAGAWLLAISPRLDSAAAMAEEATMQQSRIDQLEIQLVGLEKDAANIEEFRSGLADLRVQIPASTELAALTRQIDGLAQISQVTLTALTPGTPIAVVMPVAVVPEATTEPTDGSAAGDTSAAEGDAATATATPTPADFYSQPLDLTIVGSYANTIAFIHRLQTENPRLILVTSFTATAQEEKAAENGRPAVAAGDLETVITGVAYTLVGSTSAQPSDEGAAVEQTLPVPSGEDNPFATNN